MPYFSLRCQDNCSGHCPDNDGSGRIAAPRPPLSCHRLKRVLVLVAATRGRAQHVLVFNPTDAVANPRATERDYRDPEDAICTTDRPIRAADGARGQTGVAI